jgi:hypothetical protein
LPATEHQAGLHILVKRVSGYSSYKINAQETNNERIDVAEDFFAPETATSEAVLTEIQTVFITLLWYLRVPSAART